MRFNKWLICSLIAILCFSSLTTVEARRRFGGFGSVRVSGYTRRNGTYVRPYTRSLPRDSRSAVAAPGVSSSGWAGPLNTQPGRGAQFGSSSNATPGQSFDNYSRVESGPPPGYHVQKGAPSYVPNGYVYDLASNTFKKVAAKSMVRAARGNTGTAATGAQVLASARGYGSEGDVTTAAFRTTSADWAVTWLTHSQSGGGYLKVYIINEAGRTMGPVVSVSGPSKGRRKVKLRPGVYKLYIQSNEGWTVSAQRDSTAARKKRR